MFTGDFFIFMAASPAYDLLSRISGVWLGERI
jgi:hypothetical protein